MPIPFSELLQVITNEYSTKCMLQLKWILKSSHLLNAGETKRSKFILLLSKQIAHKCLRYVIPANIVYVLGPVVRTPVSTNTGLNFNEAFFFLLSKALSRITFSIHFRVSNHQIVRKKN